MNNDDEIGDLRPDGTRIDVNDPRESPAEEKKREYAELFEWGEKCPYEYFSEAEAKAILRFFHGLTRKGK